MRTRRLGTLEVSEVGMGCMGLSHGYGEIPSEADSLAAIRAAFDAGCTFYDTAEVYGPDLRAENNGHNERLVGAALEDVRDRVVLATKLHLSTDEVAADGVPGAVRRHLEASMARLRTEHVELYYLHRVNPAVRVEDVAAAMGGLADEGVITGWGLSQVGVDILDRAHAMHPLTAVQNIYSMVERGIEAEVIPWCLDHGVGVVPFSPVASGLLSGKVTPATQFAERDDVRKFVPQLSPENIAANQPLVDLVARVAEEEGATSAQISLAWMIRRYPHVVPIPGSKNRRRILENLAASDVDLTPEDVERLTAELDAIEVHGHRGFDESAGRRFVPAPRS